MMMPPQVLLLLDAVSLMNGTKTISEMIAEIPVRKLQSKPHQGAKEMAKDEKRNKSVREVLMNIKLLLKIIDKNRMQGRWSKDAPISYDVIFRALEEYEHRIELQKKTERK